MKIAIPVESKDLQVQLCSSFGRAPFFFVFDSEAKDSFFLENDAINSTGGAGIKAAQYLVDNHVNAVVTLSCGENAAAVLKTANIKIFKAVPASVEKNVEAYFNLELSLLDDVHSGLHHHGSK